MLFKTAVIALLLLIVVSLFSALVFLYKDGGKSERTARALTVRVSLSLLLFLALMAGFHFGLIPPHSQ